MNTMSSEWWNNLKVQQPTGEAIKTRLDYALRYAELGWAVLPCHTKMGDYCSCGDAHCKGKAKHPLLGNGCSGASTDKSVITQWFTQWPDANIGIATGKASGFFVVDVDIKHYDGKFGDESLETLEAEHGKFPATITAATGSGGRHYLFLCPAIGDIPNSIGKLAPAIDVRGEGGYIIVEPSSHISGVAYSWLDSDPVFGDDTVSPSPEWLIKALRREKKALVINLSGMYFESSELDAMTDSQRAGLMSALPYCPNIERDDWVKVGMALHTLDASERGFKIWCEWSQTCSKFDAKDQARVWLSFSLKKQDKVFKESIFYIARQHGWKSASEQANQQKNTDLASVLIEQINNPPIYQLATDLPTYPATYLPTEPANNKLSTDPATNLSSYLITELPTYPINNLFPVQSLNRLAGFMNAGSAVYSDAVTAQAVIALASTIAARRYITPQGDSCHLYVGISSGSIGSIGELRYAARGIRTVLSQSGLRRMVRDGRLSSTQALYKTLYHSPASIYLCDDYSAMINLTKRQTTGGIEIVLNHLTRLYDERMVQLDSPEEAGLRKSDDLQPLIVRPSLSMLALLHYSQLATFAKTSELGRGAVEQFLFAICDNDDLIFKEEADIFLPPDMIELLRKLRGVPSNEGELSLEAIFNTLPGVEPELIVTEYADDIVRYDALIDEVTEERKYRMFKAGARKNLRRLCTVLAAFDSPDYPVASRSVMDWAAQYVAGHLRRLLDVMDFVTSDEGKQSVHQKVIQLVLSKGVGGIDRWRIADYLPHDFKPFLKEKRAEILDTLIEDGDIQEVKVKQASGQFKKRLIHAKFLKKTKGG